MVISFKKVTASLTGVLPYLVPFIAAAQTAPAPPITSASQLQNFICTIIVGWMFTFLVILAIIFVLVAAFKYLTASGDPEKVKGASHQLIYAAVAIIVAIFAKGLPLIIGSILGASFTSC
jgi:membrane-associated phospholipid phosphatase